MGLLRALHDAAMPPAEGSTTALLQPDDGEQVGELVARLRERYARCFEQQKLRVDRRAEPGRRVITDGDDEYGGAHRQQILSHCQSTTAESCCLSLTYD